MGLPVEVNNLMLGSLGGYTVGRSLRFRSSASAYLNRTPASTTNQKTWTWSGWIKRGSLGANQTFFACSYGASNRYAFLRFNSTDNLAIYSGVYSLSATTDLYNYTTTAVYRDPSAWYHVVFALDTTQATASNRAKLYVNGVQITAFSAQTDPALNGNGFINSNLLHLIGGENYGSPVILFDGYLAEVNFIDGQALTPSSFGAYDTNGVWQPKKYSGTYGTNGFYLPFSNTTSTTTLVQDSSGNGNNWTPNNISLTAGYTYDSMLDSPTNAAGTSTGIGNYCIVMPNAGAGGSITNGNLTISGLANQADQRRGSLAVSSGKWYYEINLPTLGSAGIMWGVIETSAPYSAALYGSAFAYQAFTYSGITYIQKHNNSTASTNLTSATAGDVLQLALDLDNNKIWFGKNNTWADSGNPSTGANTAFTVTAGTYVPAFRPSDGATSYSMEVNCGQRPFSYTPPTGFKALNTYNLPAPSIANGAQYMAATTWTGDGTSPRTLTNGGNNTLGTTFAPDFVWLKSRSLAIGHTLYDVVRGAGSTKALYSNSTEAEGGTAGSTASSQYGYVSSLNSDGFSITSGSVNNNYVNSNGNTYVGWQWKGGGTGVTNNSGTITSTVSANTTAGFSIVTYTGTGANATVGHGLGVAPSMIIVKRRSAAEAWGVYHTSLGATQAINLELTAAAYTYAIAWNNTAPTSSVFNLGTWAAVNSSGGTFVAYCFAAVRGYSAFGSYTGNGSTDGTFVYTGFRPRWIMAKETSASGNYWIIHDTSRDLYNAATQRLYPNASDAEATATDYDILSNGFKLRTTATPNLSGSTYIYAAFAENPFNISRAR